MDGVRLGSKTVDGLEFKGRKWENSNKIIFNALVGLGEFGE